MGSQPGRTQGRCCKFQPGAGKAKCRGLKSSWEWKTLRSLTHLRLWCHVHRTVSGASLWTAHDFSISAQIWGLFDWPTTSINLAFNTSQNAVTSPTAFHMQHRPWDFRGCGDPLPKALAVTSPNHGHMVLGGRLCRSQAPLVSLALSAKSWSSQQPHAKVPTGRFISAVIAYPTSVAALWVTLLHCYLCEWKVSPPFSSPQVMLTRVTDSSVLYRNLLICKFVSFKTDGRSQLVPHSGTPFPFLPMFVWPGLLCILWVIECFPSCINFGISAINWEGGKGSTPWPYASSRVF